MFKALKICFKRFLYILMIFLSLKLFKWILMVNERLREGIKIKNEELLQSAPRTPFSKNLVILVLELYQKFVENSRKIVYNGCIPQRKGVDIISKSWLWFLLVLILFFLVNKIAY